MTGEQCREAREGCTGSADNLSELQRLLSPKGGAFRQPVARKPPCPSWLLHVR